MFKRPKFLYAVILVVPLSLAGIMVEPVIADSNSGISGAVSQSYNAEPSVLPGMVVELKPQDQTTVMPLSAQDIRNMQGVVVPAGESAIVLTPQSTSVKQVLVSMSGRYDVLVSNQAGSIKTGDYLTISAFPGIAMKAGSAQTEIIGRAAGNFNGVGDTIGSVPLKSSVGNTTNVAIGYIPVNVHLAMNPSFQASYIPGFLSKLAKDIGKNPSATRIYLSVIVLMITLLISGFMFYGGARSATVAIGRNPLARKVISHNMIQTILAGLVILVVGALAAYLILV